MPKEYRTCLLYTSLVFSLLFGVIHLFVGLGIKGYLCLKDGKVMDFFCDVVLWFMLLIGLILMLLPSDIFASIAQMNIVFPAWLNTGAKALAIAGAVGIVLMSGREKDVYKRQGLEGSLRILEAAEEELSQRFINTFLMLSLIHISSEGNSV